MLEHLLPLLRCPACKGTLDNRVLRLVCACGRSYAVVDGIPRFAPTFDDGFDARWREHPKGQATTQPVWDSKLGWGPSELSGRVVLDAGCGVGRFAALAGSYGATVIGLDASPSALAGAAHNAPAAMLVQGDLLATPIADEAVDVAFSVGVLHHTADPREAFLRLARTVKRGGLLGVWLYADHTNGDPVARRAADFLHEITRTCDPAALHAACERHSVALRDLYAHSSPEGTSALRTVLAVSSCVDADECVSDTFDWHVPQWRSYHTREEVIGWFAEAGYEVVQAPAKPPVTVHGRRK